ncbi:Six-hairpin glycosidase-like protein [Apiospora aurea]|uniref:Six-hairpin glycosidase-like protein n=1 Tax=Apiospora aurea TaxID=335848 RepID=A0ABR1PYV1_9PEZI
MKLNTGTFAAVLACLNAGTSAATDVKYSTWMARSIMSRGQGIMTGKGGSSEPLQAGFTQKAFVAIAEMYPTDPLTPHIQDYIRQSAASVAPFILNATNDALAYPLDRLSNGNALLSMSNGPETGETPTFSLAAAALRQSIDLNRRNREGGFWYFVYPNWSYLDGMYSLAPFYALYTSGGNNDKEARKALNEIQFQIDLLWCHTHNASSGLLVHGYDDSKTAVWADRITGASPYVWGRSLGWFIMALVDTVELLPKSGCKQRDDLLNKYNGLAKAVLKAVDPVTGAWWQVMNEPGRARNYIESSGSAMFATALLKGARLGYLKDASLAIEATLAGVRAHGYLTDTFVLHNEKGFLDYNGTVSVCSLNSTASYDYYVGQPLLLNSVLGSAAYILASLEVERVA